MAERCDCCGARALASTLASCPAPTPREPAWRSCGWCGARSRPNAPPLPPLRPGPVLYDPPGRLVDDYVLRGLAAGRGLVFRADDGAVPREHANRPARGALEPMAPAPPAAIALCVIAARADAALRRTVRDATEAGFGAVIVVLDGADAVPIEGARVLAHPLDGDFGAQRDRAQRAAEAGGYAWTFHLDTDETLAPSLAPRLHALVALAEEERLDAVGFPRLNLVDGRASDLWPDPQYRLLRASVRFQGRVHERPDACDDWRRTMVVLPGDRHPEAAPAIRHHLSRAHVEARTRRYDRMGQDPERHEDDRALARPYGA